LKKLRQVVSVWKMTMAGFAESASINTLRKSLQTTSASPYLLTTSVLYTTSRQCFELTSSVSSTTSKLYFEQPATSLLFDFH
ncbi:hypothetical protein, partial [Streptococcus pneumoniae]|uniref:hypothetical protein n=1 Tax=Streptococcus pneumoniae TaxID=1313 RepID=UPI001CA518BD